MFLPPCTDRGNYRRNKFLSGTAEYDVRGSMSIIVPRTCTEILPENPDPRREPAYGPLDTFRSAPGLCPTW